MRLLARGLALLIMVSPGVSFPLGLGDIEVNTALNQPLNAEITLHSVHQDELEDVRVVMASDEAFKRAGIDRPFALNQLRFTPKINSAGQAVIEIISKTPVREPFLNFLLEVQWPNGRLLREYTILLDPPVMFEQADTVGIQPPVVEQRAGSTASLINQPSHAPANESQVQRYMESRTEKPRVFPPSGSGSQTYITKSGDTLSKIATDFLFSQDASLAQKMIALLRANPESFIRGNINELMAGVIMRIPTQEEVAAVDRVQASAQVLRHNMLWRQYRSQLIANVPTKPSGRWEGRIQPSGQAGQTGESPRGQVPREEATEGNLKIVAADENETSKVSDPAYDVEMSQLRKDATLARELAESRAAENDELRSKVQQLEEMLASQERLINLQSEELATLQNRLTAVEQSASVGPADEKTDLSKSAEALELSNLKASSDAEAGGTDTPVQADPDVMASDQIDAATADMDEATSQVDSAEQTLSDSPAQDSEQAQTAGDNETEVAPVEAALSDSLAASEIQTEPHEAEPLEAQGESLETPTLAKEDSNRITANPMTLAVIAVTGLLLAALSWLLIGRLKKRKEAIQGKMSDDSQQQSTHAVVSTPESMASQENGVKVPGIGEGIESDSATQTAASDVEPESPEESPQTVLEAGEASETDRSVSALDQDDTLTEADVYIAYNLHQQAEDLLKEAIARNPERYDYRIKLLENYCAANDLESFNAGAEELRIKTEGTGEHWEQALSLATKLSPDHYLLTGTAQSSASIASALSESSEPDAGWKSDEAPHVDNDMVGDMGSGYLSELESEPDSNTTDFISSVPYDVSDDISKDALEFDVSDLDLSFQDDSGDESATKELKEAPSDNKPLDFELSELEFDLDANAAQGAHPESEEWPETVELIPGGDEDSSDAVGEEQLLIDAEPQVADSRSAKPIDESDIFTSDAEFEQSTNTIDLDEGNSAKGMAAESVADEDLLMTLDEAATEILPPLPEEASVDEALDLSMEEGGLSEFVASDSESDFNRRDGLENEPSLDEQGLDWSSDEANQVQPVDEVSIEPSEVALDSPSESPPVSSSSVQTETESDEALEDSLDGSEHISRDSASASDQVEHPLGPGGLADIESILTEIADDQLASGQASPIEYDSVKGDVLETEASAPGAQEEHIREGVTDNADEVFDDLDPLDEINTKLDLAKAYIDMGDAEGARGALEEVLHQGDEDQRREAESMLKQFA